MGFTVYVGAIQGKEVDFVACKGDRVVYLQCAYILADEATMQREYASLERIPDNYEKIVVSLDDMVLPSKGGIRHVQAWRLTEALL